MSSNRVYITEQILLAQRRMSDCGAAIQNADAMRAAKAENGEYSVEWRPVRPIPDSLEAFETVWRTYRENGNVF